jgi:hypothetical protein
MIQEQEKRDQDVHDMYIYNNFLGGRNYRDGRELPSFSAPLTVSNTPCTVVLIHDGKYQLADFNKVLFKKDISPLRKWAYLVGLATWLKLADLTPYMSMSTSPLPLPAFLAFFHNPPTQNSRPCLGS